MQKVVGSSPIIRFKKTLLKERSVVWIGNSHKHVVTSARFAC